jgi:hypothetical protein
MKKSHIVGWALDAPTPAQLKEFFAQCEGPNPRITKQRLQSFLRSSQIFEGADRARLILGDDFIFPDEIAEARGLSYVEDQIRQLADTIPSEDILRWLKENNFCLLPGPPQPMSLLDVRSLESKLFYSESGGWYIDQKFAKNDKANCEWLAIRKDPVSNSTHKTWEEQLTLLSKEERVPNAGEMSWFITTYYKVRNVRLFESIYVRTSSVDSGGDHVNLGDFDDEGLGVNCWYGCSRDDDIGLASARKF